MKTPSLLWALLALQFAGAASAGLAINQTFNESTAIPEGNPVPTPFGQTFSGLPSGPITSVEVDLDITGGYNGGLYAYLTLQEANGATATEVLLNQIGTTASTPLGSSGQGMNVTLSDAGTVNGSIHGAAGVPTGVWLPDSAYTLSGTFGGLTANGTWTLSVADLLNGGGASTLGSWGLRVGVAAVPEAGTACAGLAAGLLVLAAHACRGRKTLRRTRARP
jgi:hypothetical protein